MRTVSPPSPPVLIISLLIFMCLRGINIFGNWENTYVVTSNCEERISMEGRKT